jgi:RNA polymerase sigma-70 factor (ECF subfamily)
MVRFETSADPAVTSPAGGLSEAEFATLFSASFRKLWLIAVGIIGDAALAEDAVQDAALTALGKRQQFQPGTNFTAWMSQMVRFVALNQYRKQRKRKAASLEGGAIDVAASTPAPAGATVRINVRGELPVDQPHFDDRIMQALRGVAEVARACLLLRTLESLEYTEISALLGIPEGTAMSHVHRTRQYLRERLADAYGRTAGGETTT